MRIENLLLDLWGYGVFQSREDFSDGLGREGEIPAMMRTGMCDKMIKVTKLAEKLRVWCCKMVEGTQGVVIECLDCLLVGPGVFYFVPRKRFTWDKTHWHRHLVPIKRFRWNQM